MIIYIFNILITNDIHFIIIINKKLEQENFKY